MLENFCGWLSDGGGEQDFNCSYVSNKPEGTYTHLDYTGCFPAWGYDPEKDGDPTIEVSEGFELP